MDKIKLFLKNYWPLILIVLWGGFLRFFKLNWGEGYFFHPDEYHIVGAVDRLHFPDRMDPQLFSYGSFSVYLIYFTRLLIGGNSFLIGRFYSAFFSTLTLVVVYLITRKLFKKNLYQLLATLVVAVTPGIIQQAHFTTPESILTFWLSMVLLLSIKWLETKRGLFVYLAAIALGFAIGTKITGLVFFPILIFALLINFRLKPKSIIGILRKVILTLLLAGISFFIVFPFSLLDWSNFRNTTNYESGLAKGEQIVFYTKQFINTQPVIFQLEKVFPFALNPVLMISGIVGFLLMCLLLFKQILNRKKLNYVRIVVILGFVCYLIPNLILFTKWTRFVSPSFAYFAIFAVFAFYSIEKKINQKLYQLILFVFIIFNLLWSAMFFSIYISHDVRIQASSWINSNLPPNTFILTESRNTLEVPLTGPQTKFPFEFYDIDDNHFLAGQLPVYLARSNYFIIQSRRLFANFSRLPYSNPKIAGFYSALFSGRLGFKEIKEFSSYPKLTIGNIKIDIPDEMAEETWSVFDHPVVRIYQKQINLTQQDYAQILGI